MQVGNQQFFACPGKGLLPPHANTCEKTERSGHQHSHIGWTRFRRCQWYRFKMHRYKRLPLGHSVLQTSEAAALPCASFKDEAAVWDNEHFACRFHNVYPPLRQWRRSTVFNPWSQQEMPPPVQGSGVIIVTSSCSVNHARIFCFLKTFLQELLPYLA